MKLAVTGWVVISALKQGHTVLGMDNVRLGDVSFSADPGFTFLEIDLREFDKALEALKG
ncbi:hypothetical protein EWM64_g1601 [Hericium alpestre]|uniref:Uncharacterized protein n=1 Tax=Hericium alpestre TaxID=135208 RepID=A0A4Z0A7W0_9AGAM|nr:hypothetical protein EWM64_g1601 [Hericium alpestre]